VDEPEPVLPRVRTPRVPPHQDAAEGEDDNREHHGTPPRPWSPSGPMSGGRGPQDESLRALSGNRRTRKIATNPPIAETETAKANCPTDDEMRISVENRSPNPPPGQFSALTCTAMARIQSGKLTAAIRARRGTNVIG